MIIDQRRLAVCGIALVLVASVARPMGAEDLVARALAQDAHPLKAALQWAVDGRKRIQREIKDYTCLLIKRERVDGHLGDRQFMFAKVRHARRAARGDVPFGVYLKFYSPDNVVGREVLYVDGQNDGKIVARNGGQRFAFITTTIKPDSALALRDNRYPITQIGFENLIAQLVEVARDEIISDGSDVKYFKGAKVDGRECIGIEVQAREESEDSRFFLARVFIDRELQIPIHYEAFDWPEEEGGEPILLEQYTYRNVRINVGLTDNDFRRDNPRYGFR
jgi:hypothetical protein